MNLLFVCLYSTNVVLSLLLLLLFPHYSSKNGSPVDTIEEGSLVATVTKKRRGMAASSTAFNINIGDGKSLSLTDDPSLVMNLDNDVKNVALSQLKVLQDRMANLMAQLET